MNRSTDGSEHGQIASHEDATRQRLVPVRAVADARGSPGISARRIDRGESKSAAAAESLPPSATTAAASKQQEIVFQPLAAEQEETARELPSTLEVDFYRNPTVLSRLVLNQQYAPALDRLRRQPGEAAVWVTAKRKLPKTSPKKKKSSSRLITFRQLPLHTACINLARSKDAATRRALNELLADLIVAFPQGCAQADHKGRLPLQEAIRHGAFADTVSMFLIADPDLLTSQDASGRTPTQIDLFQYGDNTKDIEDVLAKTKSFWEAASQQVKELSKPSAEPPLSLQDLGLESSDVEAIAWEQLEERAIAAEQILTDANEKNYHLTERVKALNAKWLDIADVAGPEVGQMTDLTNEVTRLKEVNRELNETIQNMETSIRASRTAVEEGRKRRRSTYSTADHPSDEFDLQLMSPRELQLSQENNKLQQAYDALNTSYDKKNRRVRRLEAIVEALRARLSSRGSVSTLTDHGSLSSKSTALTDIERETILRSTFRAPVEVAWSPTSSGFQHYALSPRGAGAADDLSAIFRDAAQMEFGSTHSKSAASASNKSGSKSAAASNKAPPPPFRLDVSEEPGTVLYYETTSTDESRGSQRIHIDIEIPALAPPGGGSNNNNTNEGNYSLAVGRERLGFVAEEEEEKEQEEMKELEVPAMLVAPSSDAERMSI